MCLYLLFPKRRTLQWNCFFVRNKIQIRWVIQASQLPDAEIQSSKDLIVVPPHLNERTYRWMGPFWNLITELFHFNLFRCEWKVHSLFYLYSVLRYTSTESMTFLHKSRWMKWDEMKLRENDYSARALKRCYLIHLQKQQRKNQPLTFKSRILYHISLTSFPKIYLLLLCFKYYLHTCNFKLSCLVPSS